MRQTNKDNPQGHIHVVEQDGQVFLTGISNPTAPPEAATQFFRDLAQALNEKGAVPVHERIFGNLEVATPLLKSRHDAFSHVGLPLAAPTYVAGNSLGDAGFAGAMIHGIIPEFPFEMPGPVISNGCTVGYRWRSERFAYMMLQDMGRNLNSSAPAADQAAHFFQHTNQIIQSEGFTFQQVVRTWFYIKDILSWYDDFNRVRSQAYSEFGIMPAPGSNLLLPASTGIEGNTPAGTALTADIFLVRPLDGEAPMRIRNPAQKEAFQYGAAFSRAVQIKESGASLIELSGTAAIDERGISLYPNDAASQVSCTLDKIETLLSTVGASLRDIVSATVFVKHKEIGKIFERIRNERGLKDFPGIFVHADVCRKELLFEIDAEAIKPAR